MMDATGIENRIALCEHLERAAERATSDRRLADAALLRAAAVQIRYDGDPLTGPTVLPSALAVTSTSTVAPGASSSAAPAAFAPGAPPPRKRGRPKQQAEIPGTAQQAGAPPVPVQP